jgi:hypothetical protein
MHLEEGFNAGVEVKPTMTEASVIQKSRFEAGARGRARVREYFRMKRKKGQEIDCLSLRTRRTGKGAGRELDQHAPEPAA